MLGREGVGVNPLRGQGNVQGGSCLGSWPHMFTGYRFVTDAAVRATFEQDWRLPLDPEPGLRLPNMFDAALAGTFKAIYIQGEDPVQSDPNQNHIVAAMKAMECVIVQDLFLNETAKYAHVFLPGSSSLEKNGTFTNAERRVSMVRKVVPPLAGLEDWEITVRLISAMGYPLHYDHPSQILDEVARLSPAYQGMSFDLIERCGSVQWPCNPQAPEGTEVLHTQTFPRGKANFMLTGYVPTSERPDDRHPLLLTTGRILSQYNVGTQTRRTGNVAWHDEDLLDIHQQDAEARGIRDGDLVTIASRYGETRLHARISDKVNPGVVYTTFHFAQSKANAVTSDLSDWATNCPEYKVTAVEVAKVPAGRPTAARERTEAKA
jgi:formate dehydrogenase major subunit